MEFEPNFHREEVVNLEHTIKVKGMVEAAHLAVPRSGPLASSRMRLNAELFCKRDGELGVALEALSPT